MSAEISIYLKCELCNRKTHRICKLDSCDDLFCYECVSSFGKIANKCPKCRKEFKTVIVPDPEVFGRETCNHNHDHDCIHHHHHNHHGFNFDDDDGDIDDDDDDNDDDNDDDDNDVGPKNTPNDIKIDKFKETVQPDCFRTIDPSMKKDFKYSDIFGSDSSEEDDDGVNSKNKSNNNSSKNNSNNNNSTNKKSNNNNNNNSNNNNNNNNKKKINKISVNFNGKKQFLDYDGKTKEEILYSNKNSYYIEPFQQLPNATVDNDDFMEHGSIDELCDIDEISGDGKEYYYATGFTVGQLKSIFNRDYSDKILKRFIENEEQCFNPMYDEINNSFHWCYHRSILVDDYIINKLPANSSSMYNDNPLHPLLTDEDHSICNNLDDLFPKQTPITQVKEYCWENSKSFQKRGNKNIKILKVSNNSSNNKSFINNSSNSNSNSNSSKKSSKRSNNFKIPASHRDHFIPEFVNKEVRNLFENMVSSKVNNSSKITPINESCDDPLDNDDDDDYDDDDDEHHHHHHGPVVDENLGEYLSDMLDVPKCKQN